MASSAQQTNGANTLIVSSPLLQSHQLSSVNSSAALVNSQPSLITQSQPFLHLLQQEPIHLPPHLYQPPMFLQPQAGLTIQQHNSAIHNANELSQLNQLNQLNQSLVKKNKQNKQKIMSKTSPQIVRSSSNHQLNANLTPTVIKSAGSMLSGQQFTTQNNQAVVISQLPNMMSNSPQTNKKLLDAQKNKQIVIQNNAIAQQSLVGSQFKQQLQGGQTHLQLAQQPSLINQGQLIAPIQQLQQPSLTWTTQANHNQLVQNSPQILIRQQHAATADAQPFFIQNPNPTALQTGTPIYVNHQNGIMQLMSNSSLSSVAQPQLLTTTTTNSTSNSKSTNNSTNTSQSKQQLNSSTSKLKTIRPASSLQNLNNLSSQQTGLSKTAKQFSTNKLQSGLEDDGHKKLSKKQQIESEKNKLLTKSTQQMNLELLNSKQRSDSLKSIDSIKSKNESKLKKQQSSSLDEDSSSISSNKLNGVSKKEKSEKKVKQKAIVKPILSHCVDGYIIHESSYPFPVNITEELNDELEQIKLNNGMDKKQNQSDASISNKDGKIKMKKLKKNKLKANSSSGLITKNVLPSNLRNEPNQVETQNKRNLEQSNQEELNSFVNTPISSNDNLDKEENSLDEANVYGWSIEQVYDYLIKEGVNEAMARKLKEAEVDGRSLLLLSFQVLSNYDKAIFKLGPCLLLQKKIDELKKKVNLEDQISNYLPSFYDDQGKIQYKSDIYKWSVKDTSEFILKLSTKRHADAFVKEEMDGRSLTLISSDNIVNDLEIPFGPAQLICSKIEELKKTSTSNA